MRSAKQLGKKSERRFDRASVIMFVDEKKNFFLADCLKSNVTKFAAIWVQRSQTKQIPCAW